MQPPSVKSDEKEQLDILTDRELLTAFVNRRDENAFRMLVLRHQALVWSVCLRILPCHQDREDVFQATFVKLVMHADRIPWHETIGGWLYKVAYRMSLKTRSAKNKRLEVELLE